MNCRKSTFLILLFFAPLSFSQSLEGYDLWLGYQKVEKPQLLKEYSALSKSVYFQDETEMLKVAQQELANGLEKILGKVADFHATINSGNTIIIAKKEELEPFMLERLAKDFDQL